MDEIWKPIKDYEGLYEVSSWGRVRSLGMWAKGINNCNRWIEGRLIKPKSAGRGYLYVTLCKNNIHKNLYIHRLVAEAFPDLVGWTEKAKGKPFDELQVNHKDQNKENNRVENLEWCDGVYNQTYSRGKTVYMYTMDDKLCGLWSSTMECSRYGFQSSNIVNCCNGKYKKYKGFKWSYEPPKPLLALPYCLYS